MACPNFKNGPKNSLGPLGVNHDNDRVNMKSSIMQEYFVLPREVPQSTMQQMWNQHFNP
jgi:hypothetical protein